MSDLKLISPLLDGLSVEKEISGHNGCSCYALRHTQTRESFVVKRISIPESDKQVRALILSGAYSDDAAVHSYYGSVAADIKNELDVGMQLAESGCFAGARSYQIEPKESGIGYDVYILYPKMLSLRSFLTQNAMTGLRAINLGIDLCDALAVCREAGYLFENIKPENVFLTAAGRFLLGDLGLASSQDLQYASVPENYLGAYSPPELSEITASPNLTIDLYSVGMLLYRIYNGNHGPFEDENTGEAMADKLRMTGKPLPTPIYADYELTAIILKACASRPEERFQTPEEMKQALIYYMQRNEVSDTLIVPPIVSSTEPIAAEMANIEEDSTPIRLTDAKMLDDDFRSSFAPNLSDSASREHASEAEPDLPVVVEPVPTAPESQTAAQVDPEATTSPEASKEPPLSSLDASDPDQMNLDAFLASINEVVAEEDAFLSPPKEPQPLSLSPVEPENDAGSPAYIDADDEAQAPPEQKRKRRRSRAVIPCVIAGFLLALGTAAYFLLTYFFVNVDALEVIRCTSEELTVALTTEDAADSFTVTCSDMYGNSYPADISGNQYTFKSLSPNTQYTITVHANGHRRLSADSASMLPITTPQATEITEFVAYAGEADGDVVLNFSYEGPAPAEWKVSYHNEDGTLSNTTLFSGNTVTLSGLSLNEAYTFTLESTDSVYLSGNVSTTLSVIPIVRVSQLTVSKIEGSIITVTWNTNEHLPPNWTVSCEADGFSTVTETVTEPSFTVEVPDLARDYLFTVTAKGMTTPVTLHLPANPTVVTALQAVNNENGTVTVSWETISGSPAGGWYVTYGVPTSNHEPRLQEAQGNSITLSDLIPDAQYTIALRPADGSDVFGTVETTVDTPAGGTFSSYGVSAAGTYISLWEKPNAAIWDYRSLNNAKNAFTAEEEIALCLEVSSRNSSADTVWVLYVIRDSDGNPISDAATQCSWNEMWYNRRHTSTIPNPGTSGSYTLEIYVNRSLLKTIDFSIT